jgi:hypothetical protein
MKQYQTKLYLIQANLVFYLMLMEMIKMLNQFLVNQLLIILIEVFHFFHQNFQRLFLIIIEEELKIQDDLHWIID